MNKAAFLIAFRELSGGLKGFWVYLACIALGVFAVSASGVLTRGFSIGLDGQSRVLLGGDASFSARNRRADSEERDWISDLGTVSESVTLNVMGDSGAMRRQVDLRAVDTLHPLIGAPILSGGDSDIQSAIGFRDGKWGTAVSPSVLEIFKLSVGDEILLGAESYVIRAQLDQESDGLGTPGTFSPAATVSIAALEQAERLKTGEFFRARYRVVLDDPAQADKIEELAKDEFGNEGLRYRGPENAVDDLKELLGMLDSFLVIIGIAALIAGGVGVAQASSAFLEGRYGSIAAFKSLGASSGTIRTAYLIQLGMIATIGAVIGAGLGGLTPLLLDALYGDQIPLPNVLAFYPIPLLQAIMLGLLAAAMFAFPALGRARATKPAALFRTIGGSDQAAPPRLEIILATLSGIGLFALAILTSDNQIVTGLFLTASGVAWILLKLMGYLMRFAAKRASKGQSGMRRLMFSNLGGPGSLAPNIAPALGLGLGLLVTVVAVQANLQRQISQTAVANLPSLGFSQIPDSKAKAFDEVIAGFDVDITDQDTYLRVPSIQGRITSIKGVDTEDAEIGDGYDWAISQEIAMPYTVGQPQKQTLLSGAWWPEDYDGPLLASLEYEMAEALGVEVEDEIGLRIFGRDFVATVSSTREIDWGGFGLNTSFILSPGTLEEADPPNFAIAQATVDQEGKIIAGLAEDFPEVVVFQTRDFLQTASKLLGGIGLAVNIVASIVLFAGLLVLFGSFAAMARARRAEAALLKTLGATRGTILGLYAGEFAMVAGITALICSAVALGASRLLVLAVFKASFWHMPWPETIGVVGTTVLVSAIGGAFVG
ncbi:MAG: FtsX-like permease family protein, partial [Pseudomonadota bacterium]